jgi:hypothetical protein
MAGTNPVSNKTTASARTTQTTKRVARSAAELRRIQARNRARNTTANFVTVLMLLLTLAVLGWVAYQLNNPIALNLSQFFHH